MSTDDQRSMRQFARSCFAIEAFRWCSSFTRYRIKMFAVNFLRLHAVWKVARGIRTTLSAVRCWLARVEAFEHSYAACRIKADSQWRVSKLTALGKLPRTRGPRCLRVPRFIASKSYVERLNYYYITLKILKIFFYNYFYLICIL